MKLTLYNAITLDGFIAKLDGDSDWVSEADIPHFEKAMQDKGCIIVGRKTFEQFEGEVYPVKDVKNIVMTTDENKKYDYENVITSTKTPEETLKIVEEFGFQEVLLVGGTKTSKSFLDAGLIDEIIFSIHPLIFGKGLHVFESDTEFELRLEKLETKELDEGLVQVKYKVNHASRASA